MKSYLKRGFYLLLALLLIIGLVPAGVSAATASPGVSYQTHIQNIGWEADSGIGWRSDGDISGTFGRSLRLEGIEIKLDTPGYDLGVTYQTHIQNIGWEADVGRGWKSDGVMSGTQGESKRLEAIQMKLTGTDADKFDIYYQVHAQNMGWLGWAKNGESAGTAGYSYRLEAIKIVVVPKGDPAPTTDSPLLPFYKYVEPPYKQDYRELVTQAYQEISWPTSKYNCYYSLFDMDSNGVPELLLSKGTCEADNTFYIYTFENNQVEFAGTFHSGHTSLYGATSTSSGQLIAVYGQMLGQYVNELYLNNGYISSNQILSGTVNSVADYYKTDFPVPYAFAFDLSLLN